MNDGKIRKRGSFASKSRGITFLIAFIMAFTSIITIVMASGPHIETPRNVVINEVYAGSESWIELVNPTGKNININRWELQLMDDNGWTTIHTIEMSEPVLKRWGSGEEYAVLVLDEALPTDGATIRLIDNKGEEIDRTTYTSLSSNSSWARYRQLSGLPIDTDSDDNDWYVSSTITRGTENDSILT